MDVLIYVLAGVVIGGVIGVLIGRMQSIRATTTLEQQGAEISRLHAEREKALAEIDSWRAHASQAEARHEGLKATLDSERKSMDQRLQDLLRAQEEMKNAFGALAGQALQQSEERFLTLAEQKFKNLQDGVKNDLTQRQEAIGALVNPMREGLEKMDLHLRTLENNRISAQSELREQLTGLIEHNTALRKETQLLSQALRAPKTRGSWGEMQLRRVVELAGMQNHVDFNTQVHVSDDQQRQLPDMVINLPGNRCIVVDSKVPLDAFLQAANIADPVQREPFYLQHAKQFAGHVQALSRKNYTQQFTNAPDFVVMFVPGEHYFAVAVDHQPDLIDRAMDQGVIIASPTTLLALLRAVHFGWRQESLAENARKIGETGRELYDRIGVFAGHLGSVGKGLNSVVNHYNKAISSYEKRVVVSLRKFEALNVVDASKTPDVPAMIEQIPSPMVSDETTPDELAESA